MVVSLHWQPSGVGSELETIGSGRAPDIPIKNLMAPKIDAVAGEHTEDTVVVHYHPESKRTPETLPVTEYLRRLAEQNAPLDQESVGCARSRADYEFVHAVRNAGLNDSQIDTVIALLRKLVAEEKDFTLSNHRDLKSSLNIRLEEIITVRGIAIPDFYTNNSNL